ncbi:PREDICTED: uncharacterized protein LOC105316459 [Amphimedon queenslandica]|uniref:Dynein regulatory complex protein 12 n=1 Tax=Amphimedon queenslandica TaxID=400682 RepID=A0A1X7VM23_AMPQE|nr:PREDICTED: uncharacterized protein LOC105316459 [Amphimedon queenslandica]|eukprot:XP_011409667.1 PREDICTED: uncharacterized protein LOC105316459 [Amphimedon queenslandica]
MSKAGKKKAKKGGKKGKKKDGDDFELSIEEKFKKTSQEVGYLKEQLAERQEYARRSKATEEAMRERLIVTKAIVEEEKVNKKDISFDLTRQYKTLQLQSETKILALEETIKKLTSELQTTKQTLTEVTRQRDKLKEEKEVEVAALNNQLSFLKKSYETIIQDAMDSLAVQMEDSRGQWDIESQTLDSEIQNVLVKFGTPDIHTKPLK